MHLFGDRTSSKKATDSLKNAFLVIDTQAQHNNPCPKFDHDTSHDEGRGFVLCFQSRIANLIRVNDYRNGVVARVVDASWSVSTSVLYL